LSQLNYSEGLKEPGKDEFPSIEYIKIEYEIGNIDNCGMNDVGAIELSKVKVNLSGLYIAGNDLSNRGVKYLMRGVMTNATSLSIDMN
jgi:hypothetical protein